MSKHFMDGCPFDTGRDKVTLTYTLIDYYDTTEEKLKLADHVPGPKCRCTECSHLKDLEDRRIMKMGMKLNPKQDVTGERESSASASPANFSLCLIKNYYSTYFSLRY